MPKMKLHQLHLCHARTHTLETLGCTLGMIALHVDVHLPYDYIRTPPHRRSVHRPPVVMMLAIRLPR